MRIRYYIFSLLLSLTVMGIVHQSQNPSANQEIVLQFQENFTTEDAQQSLQEIVISLNEIGIHEISISSTDGIYRISYYSDSATHQVENLLLETADVSLSKDSNSNKKSSKKYAFDVLNIEKSSTSSWGFEANEVYTLNFKSDRSFTPDVLKFPVIVSAGNFNFNYKIAYNVSQAVSFVSDNTSHNIPEVRAGPII